MRKNNRQEAVPELCARLLQKRRVPRQGHYNLKQKTEVVKPFYGFYFGLSFLGDVQQPHPVLPLDVYAPEIIFQADTGVSVALGLPPEEMNPFVSPHRRQEPDR